MRKNFGAALLREFHAGAEAIRAWKRRYDHDRFSMALSGVTPAENSHSSPLRSGTASPNPGSPDS